ncbi:MAG: hypothetical protein ABIA77_00005, partial [Candidatus Omnitrophota bacterium]
MKSKNGDIISSGLSAVLANIAEARRLSEVSDSARIAAVVSSSGEDRVSWQERLDMISPRIFNSDSSSLVLSLEERIGKKTREGNFLGTLLAYERIKEAAALKSIPYRDHVSLVGMMFGRGERMSPVTQAKACRKPAIEVAPANTGPGAYKAALTSIEEALFYFTPVVRYLEKRGFRGVLNKWGDETEIAAVDLARSPDGKGRGEKSLREYDIIKFVSALEITPELAGQKDWVVFDENGNMIDQLPRGDADELIGKLKEIGTGPCVCGKGRYAGISLGPVAVSYEVLDIALDVFGKDVEKEGVYFDFDPYLMMALARDENDAALWRRAAGGDPGLKALETMVPDFFEKAQNVKRIFREKHGRPLNLKVLDLGPGVYWADIGQHKAMREKFLSLNDTGARGIIARTVAGLPEDRDKGGNIIVNSRIGPHVEVVDSVIVNSDLSGKGKVEKSVILDSEFRDIEMSGAFAVRSIRTGRTALKDKSGLYESLGAEDLALEEGMRHVSVLTEKGKADMTVSEDTDLRDKDRNYNVPVLGNSMSFLEAYNVMLGASMKELERRRAEVADRLNRIKGRSEKFIPIKFGTSGLRDKVTAMTDMECYINASGFIGFLKERGEIGRGGHIALGGDRRDSTPRIMAAVAKAVRDAGYEADLCGMVPSPVLANYAMEKGMPGIMVTGSHIPEDRNGIKFTKRSGEVLKSDEEDILRNVAIAREAEYAQEAESSLFDDNGSFKGPSALRGLTDNAEEKAEFEAAAAGGYIRRYLDVFPADALKGSRIVLYQHSAAGRDIVKKIFEGLGAEVICVGRSEKFVPVDTEKVSEETRVLLKGWAAEYGPSAIVSTDGDSDRPLFADEKGEFLPGDKLGALVSLFLSPDFAAVPVSANDAVLSVLSAKGVKVERTRIGSPYVIKAMNDELAKNAARKTVSWESNGGFLLGSDWEINGRVLKALPTRDAVLPLIAALLLSKSKGKKVSELIDEELPPRYTHADIVDDKTAGCEGYTAELGRRIIEEFSPGDGDILEADFSAGGVTVTRSGGRRETASAGAVDELNAIKQGLSRYFSAERGFPGITSINFIDGIRVVFAGGDAAHIRPSGNAPEFRLYATADTKERAAEIVNKRTEIVAQMVR